jgi:hypothetical protein
MPNKTQDVSIHYLGHRKQAYSTRLILSTIGRSKTSVNTPQILAEGLERHKGVDGRDDNQASSHSSCSSTADQTIQGHQVTSLIRL